MNKLFNQSLPITTNMIGDLMGEKLIGFDGKIVELISYKKDKKENLVFLQKGEDTISCTLDYFKKRYRYYIGGYKYCGMGDEIITKEHKGVMLGGIVYYFTKVVNIPKGAICECKSPDVIGTELMYHYDDLMYCTKEKLDKGVHITFFYEIKVI